MSDNNPAPAWNQGPPAQAPEFFNSDRPTIQAPDSTSVPPLPPAAPPPPPPVTPNFAPPPPARKKSKTWIWVVVIILVLLLCCCCIGIVALVMNTPDLDINKYFEGYSYILPLLI
ncbi:MAG: hypothetical protein LWX83_18675 [Anaerolineae bacterium]|nr:hypothetical protein [Anaerolineae bacterium]